MGDDEGGAAGLPGRARTPENGWPLPGDEPDAAECRTALGEDSFAQAWAEGRAMTLKHAVAYALETTAT